MRRGWRAAVLLAAAWTARGQGPATDLTLSGLTISSGSATYQASNSITASTVTVNGSANVTFQAGSYVRLQPGFQATAGSGSPTFRAVTGAPSCEGVPANVSVAPVSNSTPAMSGTFAFKSSANSAACIDWMEMNINYDNVSGGGCFLAYWPGSNVVALAGDDGYTWAMSGSLGAGTLANSQCQVNLATSTVQATATEITLNLDLAFSAALPGLQKVFLQTGDVNGLMASWQQMGTWLTTTVVSGAPAGVSIGPSSGTGMQGTFTYVGSSGNGFAYITSMVMLVGSSTAYPAVNSCYVAYDRASRLLFLLGNSGAWDGTVQQRVIGVAGTMSNSQCTVDAGASSASGSGNNLTVNLAVSFGAGWTGVKGNWMWVYDRAYGASGWFAGSPPATWTVGDPAVPPVISGDAGPRRIGVRPLGVYWGASPESIDVRSGNLNVTLPLLQAVGRAGFGVGFALSYNSQIWNNAGKLGRDVGYGYGWQLMAGSVAPATAPGTGYIYTDVSGAQYRLNVNQNGVWISGEGVYASYEAATQRLYFPSGAFWVMGCVSSSGEPDAQTRYPTLMQDTNGNQILVRYATGAGGSGANTSARIVAIEDSRAVARPGGGRATWEFSYNSDSTPHLTGIATLIGSSEAYTVTIMGNRQMTSPIAQTPPETVSHLEGLQQGPAPAATFSYSGGAELIQMDTPSGGRLRWEYTTYTYGGGALQREVERRYLKMSSSATELSYHLFHATTSIAGTIAPNSTLDDPSGGQKYWTFDTGTGLLSMAEDRHSNGSAAHGRRREEIPWRTRISGVC